MMAKIVIEECRVFNGSLYTAPSIGELFSEKLM